MSWPVILETGFDIPVIVLVYLRLMWSIHFHNKLHTQVCNDKCMKKQPRKCHGHGEKCVCNGRLREDCQPKEPKKIKCYTWYKDLQENQYMCRKDEKSCDQCWTWAWKKEACPALNTAVSQISYRNPSFLPPFHSLAA